MTSSAIIITLVTFSRPFCSPRAQTKMPKATTATIQKVMMPGLASISVKRPATCSAVRPTIVPVAVL